jgi:hypothetical protein
MTMAGPDVVSVPQAPCPKGYLIGWVIDPANGQPVKFDGLIGSAIIREGGSESFEYAGLPIQADPALPSFPADGSAIATATDLFTGAPTLVFDSGPGHYQVPTGKVPALGPSIEAAQYRLSGETSMALLTLDVRANQPNYPTVAELRFQNGKDLSLMSRDFVCWTEQPLSGEQQHPILAAAGSSNGMLFGRAQKVPFLGISDEPGPVILLGLVETREPRASVSETRAYTMVIPRTDGISARVAFTAF